MAFALLVLNFLTTPSFTLGNFTGYMYHAGLISLRSVSDVHWVLHNKVILGLRRYTLGAIPQVKTARRLGVRR